MKKIAFLLPTLILSLLIISCKKDPVTPTYPIQGLWIGTYQVTGQPGLGNQYLSYIIKPDGTILVESEGAGAKYYSRGIWTLSGTTFTSTYTSFSYPAGVSSATQTSTATFSNSGNLTGGTWANTGTAVSGTFTLTRVN
ncbi:MAG: hypothetical protein JWO92_1889 [Chitinophagaceae bacterium]|nr:hypothetical protein [Chitinophagaceae bacterium]MDB5223981.1 hypothetical protein [Chitinophagaceae bacterium]